MNEKNVFVEFLFRYLNNYFNYLILRNFENLPEDEGHDIDLLILNKDVTKINKLLNIAKKKFGIKVFKNYRYSNLLSHIIVFKEEIIHLDFFTSVEWNRIKLFKTEELLARKIKFKNEFWIINSIDFEKYSWYLFIIRKGNLKKEKYINAAHQWQNNNPKSFPNIKNGKVTYNKMVLFSTFFLRSPLNTSKGTIVNILFKLSKYIFPYGRILSPIDNKENAETIIKYCFINQEIIDKPSHFFKELYQLINVYSLISNETGVLLTKEYATNNYLLNFFFRNYIVKVNDDLQESVIMLFANNNNEF